eukprot:324051_1
MCTNLILKQHQVVVFIFIPNQKLLFKTHFKYESDFDENGIFYAIGTDFGAQTYANPAQSGLVDVVSSEMYKGESYSFIGRGNVQAYTTNNKGSFFYVDLKKNKIQPAAYTLKNGHYGDYHLKAWNLEASNDGETWTCLKKHESDKSLKGEYKSQTWTLNNINQFYSLFRIVMTGTNGKNNWQLMCSGMELYGDLLSVCEESESNEDSSVVYGAGGGTISLISDASITNYGDITSNGTTGKCIGGPINIKCTAFRNFGRIESKDNGRITIQCHSFENASDIDPQPILVMPWQFLMLDSTHQHLVLDEIPEDQRKEFVAVARNAKYRITYFDSQNVQRLVEEVNITNQNADHDETKEDIDSALACVPIQSNPLYSSIQVMVSPMESKSNDECTYGTYTLGKVLLLRRYNVNQSTPLQIDYKLNVHKFDIKTASGGCVYIHSKSEIIIQKDGAINANGCYLNSSLKSFEYESDFDANGIFYAIGTDFGAQTYANPAQSGLVDVVSSEMDGGR